MKYCPYCGADLSDGAASFCMECGKSLPTVGGGRKTQKRKLTAYKSVRRRNAKSRAKALRKGVKSSAASPLKARSHRRMMGMTDTTTMSFRLMLGS